MKHIGLQVSEQLDEWLKAQGEKFFGRKHSKSDYIRFILMQAHDRDQMNLKDKQRLFKKDIDIIKSI